MTKEFIIRMRVTKIIDTFVEAETAAEARETAANGGWEEWEDLETVDWEVVSVRENA